VKKLRLIFILISLFWIAGYPLIAQPYLSPGNEVEQGGYLQVFLPYGEGPLEAELLLGGRSQLCAQGGVIRLWRGNTVGILLMGIPSTLPPGNYILNLREEGGEEWNMPVRVLARDFISEEIVLNRKMSDLRTSQDKRKAEESRILGQLLYEYHPEEIWETGKFMVPVPEPRITSRFGDRRTFVYSDDKTAGSIHLGIDYGAPVGTAIAACGAGRVVMSRERMLTGHTVVIEHFPGVYSLYYHLETRLVEEGQLLEKGEKIGTIGMTGLVTGAHLHWEIRISGIPVEPEIFLRTPLIDKARYFSKLIFENFHERW
jgi:murein DD-endopeptidase MepM/ murein hydrolase activator NlpD